ncbi:hypothetical protein [Enterococcus olivae]
MNRLLSHSKQGFILLEAVFATGLLTMILFFYQENQLQAIKASQRQYEEVRMLRVLAEEVRERQLHQLPEKRYQLTRNGQFIVTYTSEPYHQAKIEAEALTWEIRRED